MPAARMKWGTLDSPAPSDVENEVEVPTRLSKRSGSVEQMKSPRGVGGSTD